MSKMNTVVTIASAPQMKAGDKVTLINGRKRQTFTLGEVTGGAGVELAMLTPAEATPPSAPRGRS